MFIAGHSRDIAIVADWRTRADRELDENEPGRTHVIDFYNIGRWSLGKHWLACTRIALFDHSEEPSNAVAAERRERFAQWVREAAPKRIFVLPTPDSTMGGDAAALKGTHCWQALHAPDTLDAMRGTRWQHHDTEVTALFPHARRVKELHKWCTANWLRAHKMPTLHLDKVLQSITPSEHMVALLEAMQGQPLAVDLEFNPTTDIVTAIGVSDGVHAVSIPYDEYMPRNNEDLEHGIHRYGPVGRRVLDVLAGLLRSATAKVAHNFVADIPRLEKRGFVVNGILHDTFAAHAIAFPELRHGLQHAAASLLPVPPWKSLYKPSRLARGITREDAEFWTADPRALRNYNCQDAFYTWHLARAVLPHVGTHL